MTIGITRRHTLVGTGASALVLALNQYAAAQAGVTIRQGYQTNMWGMPTYYLMRSGLLEKRGIKFEEFAVPSGNLTMQQMVARQVDLGTYAGQSFIIGHDKGGLVAIAVIETVGKTVRVMCARTSKSPRSRTSGQEDRQPDRLVDRQHFRGSARADAWTQEGRLPGSAHERERHGCRACRPRPWTPWSMSSPTTLSPRPTASRTTIMDFSSVDNHAGVHGGDA